MKITSDWHIHSRNSCDGACMEVAHLVADAREQGIEDFGLTDHLHTQYNLPDVVASRRELDACVVAHPWWWMGHWQAEDKT